MNIIYFIPVILIIGGGFMYSKKKSKEMMDQYSGMKDFILEHPNAARVYIHSKTGFKDEAIHVHSINGEIFIDYDKADVCKIHEGDKWQMIIMEQNKNNYLGFYILPGEHTMNISYINNRQGLIYDSITEYTDKVDFNFKVESNKKYLLSFDTDINKFIFREESDF